MGLLDRFQFWDQQPQMSPEYLRAMQMQQQPALPQFPQLPQQSPQPQQPRTGPQMPMPQSPLTPEPMQPSPQQMPALPTQGPQINQPRGWGALASSVQDGSLFEAPMMQAGLALMGNARGGNWAGAAQQIGQQNQQRRDNRRQERQDQMQETAFGRQQTEWGQADQQRAAHAAAVQAERDPQRRAMLLAIGSAGYGDYMAREADQRFRAHEGELDRANSRTVAGMSADRRAHLTPLQVTNARRDFANAHGLAETYNQFVDMVRTASPQALMGIGPDGAALAAQQRLLAIQAKSPAALDLGALVGADFAILDDIIGNPQNWRQLVQSGGREGVMRRLQPFGSFMQQGVRRLQETYAPYEEQMADVFGEQAALPTAAPAAPSGGDSAWSGGGPPQAAINDLRRDSSAAARQEFDAVFGQGAAARALRMSSTQRGSTRGVLGNRQQR
jgi:hypothetical protein